MTFENKIGIETFKVVTKAIAHSDNLDLMANHLTQLLVTSLGIKGCAIYILDKETSSLDLLASFGLSMKYITKGPILADKSIAANLNGQPVVVSHILGNDNIQYPRQAEEEGISAIISLPIIFLEENLGALRLYHGERWNISDQDLDSLELLAETTGLAMTYTRLMNALCAAYERIGMALPGGKAGGQGSVAGGR